MKSFNQAGISLIETLIAIGSLGLMSLYVLQMQSNNQKAINHLEYQMKRTVLKSAIVGQFLNDPNNCKCLFAGAPAFAQTPASPGASLLASEPIRLGRVQFATPNDCAGSTVPQPLITSTGLDGMKAKSVELSEILNISGRYSGTLVVRLESIKEGLGPRESAFKVPVSVAVTDNGNGTVSFDSCAASGSGGITPVQMRLILQSVVPVERTECYRDDLQHDITVACPAGKALLSCSGGPGDIDHTDEGFWVDSNYATNECTLRITAPRCSVGRSWTLQRIVANCYSL